MDERGDAVRTTDDGTNGHTALWGISPRTAVDWTRKFLLGLLILFPPAILILLFWKILLEGMPGFSLQRIYPAILLLIGICLLYFNHRDSRRNGVRRALYAELDTLATAGDGESVPTTVYERNADQLGLLTDQEIRAVTAFYGPAVANDDIDTERLARAQRSLREHLDGEIDH
ncbi:hypothetical protein [Halomicrobium katesii]|uniref:hypothetical protein n=1 Tax=Halomicrobium katesii TaxID=437163 RepID=UPI0003801DE9|nr:hypothetical protein [Halomicrobium katesii]